jgi:hypothetical protein
MGFERMEFGDRYFRLPIYYLNPLFWVAFAVAAVIFSTREARA